MKPPRHVLVVTMSRALADTTVARLWSEVRLHQVFAISARVWGGPGMLLVGDARDGDAWAEQVAFEHGWRWARYALDGVAYASDGRTRRWGTPPPRPDRRWPLSRNVEIARVAARYDATGVPVRGIALWAPWSRTSGALHTTTQLHQRGIGAWVDPCPPEYAP